MHAWVDTCGDFLDGVGVLDGLEGFDLSLSSGVHHHGQERFFAVVAAIQVVQHTHGRHGGRFDVGDQVVLDFELVADLIGGAPDIVGTLETGILVEIPDSGPTVRTGIVWSGQVALFFEIDVPKRKVVVPLKRLRDIVPRRRLCMSVS